jgi:hypothetical protein
MLYGKHVMGTHRFSILAGESGVQGRQPLPEREVSSHLSSSKIPRKDGDPTHGPAKKLNASLIDFYKVNRYPYEKRSGFVEVFE